MLLQEFLNVNTSATQEHFSTIQLTLYEMNQDGT